MTDFDNSKADSWTIRLDKHGKDVATLYGKKLGITSLSGCVKAALTAIENHYSSEILIARLSRMEMQLTEISRQFKLKPSSSPISLDTITYQLMEFQARLQSIEARLPDPDHIHPLLREQLRELVRGLEHLAYILKADEMIPPVEDYLE